MKLDDSDYASQENGYKNILEQMFSDGEIEIKRRIMHDRVLSELYSNDNAQIFYESYQLLAAIFSSKGMLHLETFLELSKDEFVHILGESGILNEHKNEEEG